MFKKTTFLHLKKRINFLGVMSIFLMIPCSVFGETVVKWNAEENLFTVQATNSTVKDILNYIETHSDYVFVYSENVQKVLNNKVSISVVNRKIDTILKELSTQTKLEYKISGRQVIISMPQVDKTQQEINKKNVKVTGNVADENGEALIGASVMVKGSTMGTITDIDGNFSLDAFKGATLLISYIGYTSQETSIDNRTFFKIVLKEDSKTLEEVVVIGYGTVKKKDLTGAVAAVKGDDLVAKKTTTLSTALQGSVSGMMVRRDNNAPGASASSIHVRGITTMDNSEPLIIVDGVQCDNIDYVNSNDVENISVLKDAAAASIYGAKAAAGVILITTKRGSQSDLNLTYTGEFGWEIPTKQPSMVGVTRYLEMNNELLYNDNPGGGLFQLYTSDQVKNWVKYNKTDPNNYPIVNWRDLMLNNSAPRQTHTVSLSGGNKSVRTQASLSYDEVDGLYDGRGFQRYMFRVNNDFTINDKLSATLDVNIRHAKNRNSIYDPFGDMRKMPAVYPATWDDGRLASGKSGANPYGLLLYGGRTVAHSTQIGGKAALNFKPFDGLSLQAIVAPFINYQKNKKFRNQVSYTLMDNPDAIGGNLEGGGVTYSTNELTEERKDNWHVTTQVIANYMKSFGKHDITLMAGYENYVMKKEELTAGRDQYELTQYPYLNIGPEDYMANSGTGSEYTSNSVFGRAIYSYADRYLFQANIRYDGSSRFASQYRWGTFPSFSAGWVVSEEKFMKNANIDWLSFLKLRTSWGMLGNERIGDNYFPYMALMTFNNALFYKDGAVVSEKTAAQRNLAVEDITWETTTSTDIGVDLGFLNNRLRVTADYYWKKTKDMLLSIEIPYSMGYANPKNNAGKMSTTGFDLEISWNDRINDFSYGISANLSDFKSKIDYLRNSDIISDGKVKRAGVLFNEWYGYVCEGIYQTQEEVDNSATLNNQITVGDLKYKDISGPDGVPDGKISADYDRVPLGNSLPRFQYGGNIHAGYKGIDLSVAFQGIGKQNAYLTKEMVQPLRDNYGNIPSIVDGNYWSPFNTAEENAKAKYPRLNQVNRDSNYATSSFWLFNGAYFRLKNVTLGYTLPSVWTQKAGIKKVRLYVSASDLFCISNYPEGWDPEMGVSSYPITTSLLFGLSVNF